MMTIIMNEKGDDHHEEEDHSEKWKKLGRRRCIMQGRHKDVFSKNHQCKEDEKNVM